MPQKNEKICLEITGMTQEGGGVGHLPGGMAVFVPEAAVGDRLTVQILKEKKSYCYGKIEEISTPSPDRVPPDCAVSRRCGGCAFRHIAYAAELRHKQSFVEENLRRIGGFTIECEPILASEQETGYRNKAQYPIRRQKGRLVGGFFAARTHEVVAAEACLLQPPVFSLLLDELLAFMWEKKIEAYDEVTRQGLMRHLYLRRGSESGEVMVCLVINGKSLPDEPALVERLRAICPEIRSVVVSRNAKNTNVILGDATRVIWGEETIADTFCGLQVRLAPETFYQVNSRSAEQLYALAAEYAALSGTETLLDLYCGAGLIGLSMAGRAHALIGVEIVPQAVQDAKDNAQKNGITNARFLCADAGEAAARLEQEGIRPDVVVVDPPRKGCDAATLEAVARMNPARIVYISCNSATLARDCAILREQGYQLVRCCPVDLFPRTAHVEAVCLLQKSE